MSVCVCVCVYCWAMCVQGSNKVCVCVCVCTVWMCVCVCVPFGCMCVCVCVYRLDVYVCVCTVWMCVCVGEHSFRNLSQSHDSVPSHLPQKLCGPFTHHPTLPFLFFSPFHSLSRVFSPSGQSRKEEWKMTPADEEWTLIRD